MPLKSYSTRVVFITSGFVSILCLVVLISGVCRTPSADNSELRFVSEYISSCLQTSVYHNVPWVLAVAVVASMLSVLLNWQEYHESLRYQALAIHALVFHFCFNLACVVEFRTDGTAFSQTIAGGKLVEASLHQIAAVQAIVDFVFIHLIISSDSCEDVHAADPKQVNYELCLYRFFENVYGCCTYIFLVCWAVHAMLQAAIFEWFLVLCAIAMQWFGIRRGAVTPTRDFGGNKFRVFAGKHSLLLLQWYVLINLTSVIVFTPPRFLFGVDAPVVPMREREQVHTGPEFWSIVFVSAVTVSMSISACIQQRVWLFCACFILFFFLVYALRASGFDIGNHTTSV